MDAHNICSSAIVGEVLHGSQNYANWRACIAGYLSVRDLWYGVVVEGASERAEILEPWWKRNVSALHAIQISCAPTMLSYIRDETIANDAWNTLAQKCEPPSAARQPVTEVVEHEDEDGVEQDEVEDEVEDEDVLQPVARPLALDFLNCINRSDLETTKLLLRANPHLSKRTGPDFYSLAFAVRLGKPEIIYKLLCHMSEEDVKVKDEFGNTALHYAAMTGHTKIAERLIRRNKELLNIPEIRDHIPLISSCISGQKEMTHFLYNETTPAYLLSPENRTLAASVVCECVASNLLGVALDLLRRCPELAVAGASDDGWNAVQALSCEPSLFLTSSELSFWQRRIYSCLKVKQSEALSSEHYVRINTPDQQDTHDQQDQKETKNFMMQGKGKLLGLWSNLLKFFGIKQIYDLKLTHVYAHELLLLMSKTIAGLEHEQISQSFVADAIVNASQRGMTEFIVEIIKKNLDFYNTKDKYERNIFQIAAVYRQEKVFSLIYGHEAMKYDFPNYVDIYENNMLHLAGKLEPAYQRKLNKISGAALQMQRELQWFKEVESIMPPALRRKTNKAEKTPYELFDESHDDLVKEGEQWIKGIAESSAIVGSLIITIMFAALFSVPGGNNQETGIPLLLTKKLFKLFIISDAISLFASSTSVLISVGLLTSRYSKDDFLTSLPTKLIIGLFALFISLAAMMVAFCSTVFIVLKGQLEIVIPIVFLAAIPICIFIWLQFPLLVTVFLSTYGPGPFDRKMKKWL